MRVEVRDGVALAVHRRPGPAGAPALVAVHGFGGGLVDFVDHAGALAATHDVVLLDLPGHGASEAPADPGRYRLDRFVDDVVDVVDALGLPAFRLLGHSMGGVVAQRLALRAPDRVEALVLMDTWPGAVPGFEADLVEAAAALGEREGKAVLRSVLDAVAPLDTPAARRLRAASPEYERRKAARWEAVSLTMWVSVVRELVALVDESHRLAAIRCPTLVVVGELDLPFRPAAERLAAAVPGARLAVVPDAGHEPQLEAPAAWLAALDGFLATVGGRAGTVPPSPGARGS